MADGKEEEKKKGGGMKIVLIVLILLIVVGGSVGGGLYFGGFFGPKEGEEEGEEKHAKEVAVAKMPAIYVALDPAFVTNFSDPNAKARFLQINASVLTRDPLVEADLTTHITAIRSKLSLLFSTQKEAELRTVAGQEKLAADALAVVSKIIAAETGKAMEETGVEEFLITGMVMQ
ncbi:MAG: flagellar basal body-associated FliL family protein [Thiotrichales bacterium]|nr:flagellar basal body-associated FliL family protein [Thiotrichales bacterium]